MLGQPLSAEPYKTQATGAQQRYTPTDAEGTNRGPLSAAEWAEAAARESCSLLLLLILGLRMEAQTPPQGQGAVLTRTGVAGAKGPGESLRKVLGCLIPLVRAAGCSHGVCVHLSVSIHLTVPSHAC